MRKMFGRSSNFSYEVLPQRDDGNGNPPGLFTSGQSQYNSGFSFDYVPKIKNNDFTDESQGLVSRFCNLVVIFLVFLCTFITFPISAWFVLKMASQTASAKPPPFADALRAPPKNCDHRRQPRRQEGSDWSTLHPLYTHFRFPTFPVCFVFTTAIFKNTSEDGAARRAVDRGSEETVPNYERIVVFRLGRVRPPKGPGVVLVLPLIDQWQRVDLRTRAFNIPPCRVTTKDGGLVSVGADIQFRIWNPVMSVVAVQDLNASTRLTAQNAMTQALGKKSVREIQTERVKLGEYLGMDINDLTKPWGLEVDRVELTLESVLRAPDESYSESLILPPSVPGLEGLTGPIQQLAMHFLGQSAAGSPPTKVLFTDELSTEAPVTESSSVIEELLAAVRLVLSEGLVRQVGACFQFHISTSTGQTRSYYVDLTRNSGTCGAGEVMQPDVSLSMSEQDMLAMFQGSLRPITAYSSGRLRVQGDLNTAMKLDALVKLIKPP
ncbi:stomatin-like protein 1 isoform X2 [Neoarius graeffei]|uniref:stomatin-like protein 1 isoform X2 n=1 Tax=Neoarius graeffei TaxID=443677 RepID=UPI00298D114D|nr:stomatin-like protein 1 isoform X2 [Neoarius graeffei]